MKRLRRFWRWITRQPKPVPLKQRIARTIDSFKVDTAEARRQIAELRAAEAEAHRTP